MTDVAPVLPSSPDSVAALLEVRNLSVEFGAEAGSVTVVDGVGFSVAPGEILGLVGESGSGKSVSSLAVMGLIPPRSGRVRADVLRFGDRDLLALGSGEMRRLRGSEMSMIFQEPMTSLNPVFTVGSQVAEAVRAHGRCSRAQAKARAIEMLDRVGIPDPHRRMKDFPHAFSGGMRQRAMIAMALINEPRLLIADEPTTALDVTIQAQILDLLRGLQRDTGMSVVFVTHDLGVVAEICDRVVVMYAGQVVEQAAVGPLFGGPQHPYTEGLMAAMPQVATPGSPLVVIPGQVPNPGAWPTGCRFAPRCDYAEPVCDEAPVPLETRSGAGSLVRCARVDQLELQGSRWVPSTPAEALAAPPATAPLLEVKGLRKDFPLQSGLLRRTVGFVKAVDGIDLSIAPGQTLGLVGESGSGKSTTARLILRLIEPTGGTVLLDGEPITELSAGDLRKQRRGMQIVFQDPYSSLDPRSTIAETVGEPLEVHDGLNAAARDERVTELLDQVGLGAHLLRRYPHEFSGGQRQRIAIARALALRPKLLILDEPVSSLDVSTQSQVINLLTELQDEIGLAYLFIAHDLSVVRHISDRIAVMYLGRVVEEGDAEDITTRPTHPYTEALLSAIPVPDPIEQRRRERIVLEGDVPSPLEPPSGCYFHPRCRYTMDICREVDPPRFVTDRGTSVACHLHTSGPELAGRPVTVLSAPPAASTRSSGT
ncbi:MAG: ABC transporter ATP-binding protein [Acidimicrobiia bacterium]